MTIVSIIVNVCVTRTVHRRGVLVNKGVQRKLSKKPTVFI